LQEIIEHFAPTELEKNFTYLFYQDFASTRLGINILVKMRSWWITNRTYKSATQRKCH